MIRKQKGNDAGRLHTTDVFMQGYRIHYWQHKM